MTRRLRVWAIHEESPGHRAQVAGLLDGLDRRSGGVEARWISGRSGLSGWRRWLLRRWIAGCGPRFPEGLVSRLFADGAPETNGVPPDLLVSSGGKSVFGALWLSRRTGAPFVFIGERKPYPSAWFHTVLTPSPRETGENDIPIELIPTGVGPRAVERAAAERGRPEGVVWAMLIGGRSRSHRYSEKDWRDLADGMNVLASRHGIRWLVTTSRRTGARAEAILRAGLKGENVAEAVWWSENPAKTMRAFLGLSERAFVSQDSVTMVSEAAASGRPTTVVRPKRVRFPAASFVPGYLERLEGLGAVVRADVAELDTAPAPKGDTLEFPGEIEDRMADAVLRRVGLRREDDENLA